MRSWGLNRIKPLNSCMKTLSKSILAVALFLLSIKVMGQEKISMQEFNETHERRVNALYFESHYATAGVYYEHLFYLKEKPAIAVSPGIGTTQAIAFAGYTWIALKANLLIGYGRHFLETGTGAWVPLNKDSEFVFSPGVGYRYRVRY